MKAILKTGLLVVISGGVAGAEGIEGAARSGNDSAPIVAGAEVAKPTADMIAARRLAKAGRLDQAETEIARDEVVRSANRAEQEILVALELWSMAQEARNQARGAEAVELAARAKRRLAMAARHAGKTEQVRIAKLRYELAQEYPGSEREVAERLAELQAQQRLADVVVGEEVTQ